jgi:hypothetical protein
VASNSFVIARLPVREAVAIPILLLFHLKIEIATLMGLSSSLQIIKIF